MKEELKIIEEVIKDYKINLNKLKKEKYINDIEEIKRKYEE